MCGRFNFSNHSKVKGTKEVVIKPSFNIAPSSAIAYYKWKKIMANK
jgi:hypothetical protein